MRIAIELPSWVLADGLVGKALGLQHSRVGPTLDGSKACRANGPSTTRVEDTLSAIRSNCGAGRVAAVSTPADA